MKKVKLLLGIFCLIFVSACNCCNKGDAEGAACQAEEKKCCAPKCEMSEEQKACFEQWQNFDNLSAEEQAELLAKAKGCLEQSIACQKACIEKCEATLADFDNLTVAEQKEFLDGKVLCTGKGMKYCKAKKECSKEEKKECTKAE